MHDEHDRCRDHDRDLLTAKTTYGAVTHRAVTQGAVTHKAIRKP